MNKLLYHNKQNLKPITRALPIFGFSIHVHKTQLNNYILFCVQIIQLNARNQIVFKKVHLHGLCSSNGVWFSRGVEFEKMGTLVFGSPISTELPHGKNPQAARWPRTHMVPSGSIHGGGGGDVDVTLSQRFRFLVPTSLTVNFCVTLWIPFINFVANHY